MVDHNERPTTPPLRSVDTSTLQVTPEHVRQIEINRLKGNLRFNTSAVKLIMLIMMLNCIAKAAQRQRESEASSSSTVNSNNKRSLAPTRPGQEPSSTSAASSSKPLKRDSRLGTYFEYDLSKMVNSKGGFLVDDGRNVDMDLIRKEKERELQRNVHNLDLREFYSFSLSTLISLTFSSLQLCSSTQPSIRNARNARQ